MLITPAWQVKPMVSKSTSCEHLQPNSNIQDRKSSFGSKFSKLRTSEKRNTSVSAMVSFREKLFTERLSQEAAKLISSARRNSAVSWHSWYNRRDVDSIRCVIIPILEFLIDLFQNGLIHTTLVGYKSATSAYNDPINSFPNQET